MEERVIVMTEKRFTIDSDGEYFDRVNQRYVTLDKLFDELNMLHEEVADTNLANEILQERVEHYRKENEQLKQRINSRLHFYRELYESTNDNVVKRVVEDLEDILR